MHRQQRTPRLDTEEVNAWRVRQVVTVPAHFDEQQRAATLLAAQMAGLPRVQLLQGAPPLTFQENPDSRVLNPILTLISSFPYLWRQPLP